MDNILRLGDMYVEFDDTGALIFKRMKDNTDLCSVNSLGVSALRDFINQYLLEDADGGFSAFR